ncbi:MAG: hypothetical protein K8R25_12670 [Methanosarcinales archaeon]|nr:hypothetical protein [Methanosarcinales archaeon]
MKKSVIIGVLIVGLIAISIGLASAQYGESKGYARADFIDADGDGACDNLGNRPNFVDADGDGVCDNPGNGANFIDVDGDGTCDNIGKNGRDHDGDGIPNRQDDDYRKNPRDGSGHGHGRNRLV